MGDGLWTSGQGYDMRRGLAGRGEPARSGVGKGWRLRGGGKERFYGPPFHCRSVIGHRAWPPHRHAAPRLAVFGRPSAPWADVPALRILKVLVLAPCRAPGSCSPPGVPAPAKRLGGQATSAWVRASRASVGRWGFAGRRPVWQTASSSGAACSSCYDLRPGAVMGGGPADVRPMTIPA